MRTMNIHEAKTNFSRLVDAAAGGEVILIAKAGHPVARLTRLDAPETSEKLGFYGDMPTVPENFDDMACDDLADLFDGERTTQGEPGAARDSTQRSAHA